METSNEIADKSARLANFIIDLAVVSFLSVIIFIPAAIIFPYYLSGKISELSIYPIYTLYYLVSEGIWGQTIGKILTKTVVVDKNGNKPSFGKIVIRTLVRWIPFDGVSYAFGSSSSGMHDYFSKTKIVSAVKRGTK